METRDAYLEKLFGGVCSASTRLDKHSNAMGLNEVLDGVWGKGDASFPEPGRVLSSYPERQSARRRRSPLREARKASESLSLDRINAKHVE